MKDYKKKILCVIQARGGSKGIKKKNIYPINGHPLISYTLYAAFKSKFINEVYVSTDSRQIAKESIKYGGKIPFLRSKILSKDKVSSYASLVDFVMKVEKKNNLKYDYILELPCVSPFRTYEYIDKAINLIQKNKSYDSVTSYVNTGEKHPIRLKRILNNKVTNFCKEYPESELISFRQDFENSYIRNGAIYLMTRNCLFNLKSRLGKKNYPLIMPMEQSINIDEKFDLLVAKSLIESGYCKNKPKHKSYSEFKIYNNKNKKKLLISSPFGFIKKEKEKLIKKYNCIFAYQKSKNFVKKIISGVDGWICSPSPQYKIDKDLLKRSKRLKVIVTPSTGHNHIDINFAKNNNIKVFTLRDSNKFKSIKASSEYTFALMLNVLRRINLSQKIVKSGYWRDQEAVLRSNELLDKNLGIVGFGRIGSNLSKYAKPFGLKILAYDPNLKIQKKGIKQYSSIKKLLTKSDIVCCCINYTKKNENFFSAKLFKYMKKNSYFINTSRGELVVEKDLLFYLKNKTIQAAGVDVVKKEHNLHNKKNILIEYSKTHDNLIVTPHIAGLTYESETKAAQISTNFILKNL